MKYERKAHFYRTRPITEIKPEPAPKYPRLVWLSVVLIFTVAFVLSAIKG